MPVVEVGNDIWRPSVWDREKTGDVNWKPYFDLHGAGDFGDFGKLADVGPLSAEQSWLIGLEPQAVRNARRSAAGSGACGRSGVRRARPAGNSWYESRRRSFATSEGTLLI